MRTARNRVGLQIPQGGGGGAEKQPNSGPVVGQPEREIRELELRIRPGCLDTS